MKKKCECEYCHCSTSEYNCDQYGQSIWLIDYVIEIEGERYQFCNKSWMMKFLTNENNKPLDNRFEYGV